MAAELIRVLCVDDEAHDRELIRHALEVEGGGFEVTEASDRETLEGQLRQSEFDIVLTDFNILGFEGLDVITMVAERFPTVPVIVVTGTGSEEVAVASLRRGAADYVIKTTRHIAKLPETIRRVLEQSRTEIALRKSETRFRHLVENNIDAVLVVDRAGVIRFVNPAGCRLFGRDREALIGAEFGFPVVDAESSEVVVSGRREAESSVVELRAAEIEWEGEPASLASLRDVTDRRRALERIDHLNQVLAAIRNVDQLIVREKNPLRLIEEVCRLLSEARDYHGVWIALEGGADEAPVFAETGFGKAVESLAGQIRSGTWPPCRATACVATGAAVMGGGGGEGCASCPAHLADRRDVAIVAALRHAGIVYGMMEVSVPAYLACGDHEQELVAEVADDLAYALHGIGLEQQRLVAQDQLRRSEAALREAQAIAGIGRWELDLVTRNLQWSDSIFDIFEVDRERLGTSYDGFLSMVHPDDRGAVDSTFSQAITDREPYAIGHRVVTAEGSVKWVHEIGRIEYADDGTPLRAVGTVQDITAMKTAEEEIRSLQAHVVQVQKIEAIGQLAGGVAHDFNNMLGVIIGYGDDLIARLEADDPRRDLAVKMVEAGRRSAALTRQLLAFGRKQTLRPKVLDLNSVISEIQPMLQRILAESIELDTVFADDLHRIEVDPVELEQVLMNLVINARHAMLGGGTLTITTANFEMDRPDRARHPELEPGDYVSLTIGDTGCGMDAAVKERIFEPFFTTKEKRGGTGLGLASVYGIVHQSGGDISVVSEPGVGTTFTILLPSTELEAPEEAPEQLVVNDAGGGELLLIVEDDPALQEMFSTMLDHLDYRVVMAPHGDAALRLVGDEGLRPDLVITDVVMPRMNGPELAERLRSLIPTVKVLFMSGYPDQAMVEHGLVGSEVPFIQKPFRAVELAAMVASILHAKTS